ncbi:hypothetical protein DINM_001260 [Dirofilaria immitis]|nr:hypothetical protein [Dirofilaria immitis]
MLWWWRSSTKEIISKHYAQVFKECSKRDAFVLDPVKMTVSPDGKYVFIIGSRKIMVTSEHNPMEWTTSFKMDVFNLNLEGRQTLLLNDLFDFGDYFIHVYALNSNTLVILDYNHRQTTLRQRIIKITIVMIVTIIMIIIITTIVMLVKMVINHNNENQIAQNIAISPFHRCYHYGTSQTSFIKAAVGDRLCAIVSRQRFEGQFVALIVPKDPIESEEFNKPINVSIHVNNMNAELHATLSLNLCHYIAPFFSHNDHYLCFLTIDSLTLNIEPTNVSCLDLCSCKWFSRNATVDEISGFPRDEYQQTPILVGLVARYRTPPNHWRWKISSVLQWMQMRFVRLDRLVLRPYARLGILNLRSWKWIDYSYMLKDIHYVDQLTDLASESGQIISFISQTWNENECEQSIRVGKSPVSMMSLFAIADFELRRQGSAELCNFRHQFLKHAKII